MSQVSESGQIFSTHCEGHVLEITWLTYHEGHVIRWFESWKHMSQISESDRVSEPILCDMMHPFWDVGPQLLLVGVVFEWLVDFSFTFCLWFCNFCLKGRIIFLLQWSDNRKISAQIIVYDGQIRCSKVQNNHYNIAFCRGCIERDGERKREFMITFKWKSNSPSKYFHWAEEMKSQVIVSMTFKFLLCSRRRCFFPCTKGLH